jgi:serine/threonine protein phosphatase PrpC
VSARTTLVCTACGAELLPDDDFCEACGTVAARGERPAALTCATCGAPAADFDEDRYCTRCGTLQVEPFPSDEVDEGRAAGISHRGRVHRFNEDALFIRTDDHGVVVVVCDGVSTSVSASRAARAAAEAAGGHLVEALGDGLAELESSAAAAAQLAGQVVAQLPWTPHPELAAPACTLVAGVCRAGEVFVVWVGDSRAYWVDDQAATLLTTDDSWPQEQVDAGRLTAEEAATDPRSHAITRWLGVDAPPGDPRVIRMTPTRPGRLVLCSDGLWNYAAEPEAMAALVRAHPPTVSPLEVSRALVRTALEAGGHDNVTVAVVDLTPGEEEP